MIAQIKWQWRVQCTSHENNDHLNILQPNLSTNTRKGISWDSNNLFFKRLLERNVLFKIKKEGTYEPSALPNNVPLCFSCCTAERTQGNNPHDAFGSAPCSLSVGRIFLVCTKYCRMLRLSPFLRLNVLNLICFATLDWYLPKHNGAWKLVLQEKAPSFPLAFRKWLLVHHEVWIKNYFWWNRKWVSFLTLLWVWSPS